MLLIEKIMAAFANFVAVDVMKLDAEDVARARRAQIGEKEVAHGPSTGRQNRQTVIRFRR